jgi:hypothetical protein
MGERKPKHKRRGGRHLSPSPVHKAAAKTGNAAGAHEKDTKKQQRRQHRADEAAAERGEDV